MTRHQISVDVLDDIAKDQGVELKPGDIFIVRSGFTKWYEAASQEERNAKIAGGRGEIEWTGVEGSVKTAEWLWNHHFAAVAGDSISWEVCITPLQRSKHSIDFCRSNGLSATSGFTSTNLHSGVLPLERSGIWRSSQ